MGIGSVNPYRRTARIEFINVPVGAVAVGVWKFPRATRNRPTLGHFVVAYTVLPLPTYVDDGGWARHDSRAWTRRTRKASSTSRPWTRAGAVAADGQYRALAGSWRHTPAPA